MANNRNFKCFIVLDEDPFIKDPTVTKTSAVQKSTSAHFVKHVSQEIYTNKTKGIKYLVLQCLSEFTQKLGEMCLDTEMIHLYEHFVLCGSILLSEYWREACTEFKDCKEGNIWSNGLFVIIMKECKNRVLSGEHAVP